MPLTVVLLPGLDGSGDLFAPFVAAAPPGIRTVVVRYPVEEAPMEILRRRAEEKLVEDCVVVAESFSGPIGVRASADPRVRALVLCNSFVRSPLPSSFRRLAVGPSLFAITRVPRFVLSYALLGRHASPELVAQAQQVIRSVPPRVYAHRVRQTLEVDETSGLRALARPILYLRGLSDRVASEECWRRVRELRPDAQIARIAGPHLLLQVAPQECWSAILKFLAQASPVDGARGGPDERLERDKVTPEKTEIVGESSL